MGKNFYIVIEGVIGVGKTTLARLLQPAFEAKLLLEVFEENPFLGKFYEDRARYAFQTQIFFLLSRYHQQRQVLPAFLADDTLISDYSFAKDRLFAHLNLVGDELEMYDRVHSVLAEHIACPDLVVYLRANTDVLMERIAIRDRPYERGMDRDYIDKLRCAYERFFANYADTPSLVIDTNALNFVQNPDDLAKISNQIRSALGLLPHQPALLSVATTIDEADRAVFTQGRRRLCDFQRWHRAFDVEKGFVQDVYFNFIRLTEGLGKLGGVLTQTWRAQTADDTGASKAALPVLPVGSVPVLPVESVKEELADCLACLLKVANDAGVDLEQAYLQKMQVHRDREWTR